jgi:hypothetical protein
VTDSTATLIRNGRVITASDDYVADVLLQNGIVHTIGQAIEVGPDVRVVDATGLYVLPGGVDTHVHLENVIGPTITADTFASGTKAAAFGGTTTIVDFALQTQLDSPLGAIARAQRSAESQVNVDYSLHVIVTRVDEQVLKDVRYAMHHEGVTSFKMFMAYPGVMMADDASIFRMLRQVGADGGMVALHAENGTVIDLLINRARSCSYSTAPPAALAHAALAALDLLRSQQGDLLRHALHEKVLRVRDFLPGCTGHAAILPVILGTESDAMSASQHLKDAGFLVPCIRYPTVARGSARLRVTLSAAHTQNQIGALNATFVAQGFKRRLDQTAWIA